MNTVPDIRQQDDHDCGHAVMRCVIQHHAPGSLLVIDLSTPQFGLDPATMEALFRAKLGWCTSCGERTYSDLAHYCRTDRPVICPIQLDAGGHYVIVHRVTEKRVHFQCPIDGPKWMGRDEWLRRWTDGGRFASFWRFGLVAWPRMTTTN